MEHMHGTHDMSLVVLSYIIAFMASLTALDLARRVNFSKGWKKKIWLISGSCAMGIGIWAMHFIAMLAFKLPVAISYNVFLVVTSIVVAIAASLCGLYFICHPRMSMLKLCLGGTFMGLGISGMHYIGMLAMKGLYITYHPALFAISLFIAIGASIIALMLAFQYRDSQKGMSTKVKFVSGIVMGVAITGMHYTGMAAANFQASHDSIIGGTVVNYDIHAIVISIAVSVVVILSIVLVSSFILDQRLGEEIAFKGAILESVLDCVIIIDHQGNIVECNPSVERIFGYSYREIAGQNMETLFLCSSSTNISFSSPFIQDYEEMMLNRRLEHTGVRKNGEEFSVEMTVTRIKKDGPPVFTVYARDITDFKKAEETIRHMAYHDTLTGLPNRRMFNEKLTKSITEAQESNTMVAVGFLDLDRFKIINDSLGHAFGDLLLCNVAERLRGCLDTHSVVSRNGGDEFTFIIKNATEQTAADAAQRIIDSLIQPFHLEEHEVFITTSMGLSLYPEDGKDSETLMKNADAAMYKTKEQGKNNFSFFKLESNMNYQQLELENEMRRAIEHNQFVVYYQPQFNIYTRQIIGAEALVRWNHPERGLIQPKDFIPLAEETRLIIPLGNWILHTAISQWEKWQKQMYPLQLSVNLSAVQFQQPDVVNVIKQTLKEAGLKPSLLNIEITESMAMIDVDATIRILHNLKSIGINISMDDFGTGHSSLCYLRKMPIDELKIDKSFMNNVIHDPEDAAIVKAIISMAKSLNIDVIAEGVENEDQKSFLKEQKCTKAQGYLLSPPVPAEEFTALIRSQQ
ncbi:EAL domain-containing protein [Domibacillus sp. A3M-37]|uniref:bifunctional diguanylate cyclase/phosphodiesterase n=1 Tax=Domibacillus sp. A3M-37 TaxID=2962037 RepID=UPI0020B67E3C|nr:bifunctional diguanylate cyclase/phosphodiesterase [Domibacillus sp. A3M-37]MCP3764799.1 EAL domain-containing protein [Domibacillus sp. A3M-37]